MIFRDDSRVDMSLNMPSHTANVSGVASAEWRCDRAGRTQRRPILTETRAHVCGADKFVATFAKRLSVSPLAPRQLHGYGGLDGMLHGRFTARRRRRWRWRRWRWRRWRWRWRQARRSRRLLRLL